MQFCGRFIWSHTLTQICLVKVTESKKHHCNLRLYLKNLKSPTLQERFNTETGSSIYCMQCVLHELYKMSDKILNDIVKILLFMPLYSFPYNTPVADI